MKPEDGVWLSLKPRQDMWLSIILNGLIAILGLIFIQWAGRKILFRVNLFRHGVETTAVVESAVPQYNLQNMVITYSGHRHLMSESRLIHRDYKPGDRLPVLYNPRNINQFMIGSKNDSLWTIINGAAEMNISQICHSQIIQLILGILLVFISVRKIVGERKIYFRVILKQQQLEEFIRQQYNSQNSLSESNEDAWNAVYADQDNKESGNSHAGLCRKTATEQASVNIDEVPRDVSIFALLSYMMNESRCQSAVVSLFLSILLKLIAAQKGYDSLLIYIFDANALILLTLGLAQCCRFYRLMRWGVIDGTLNVELRTDNVPTMPGRRAKFVWIRKKRLYYRFRTLDGKVHTARTFSFLPDSETVRLAELNRGLETQRVRQRQWFEASPDYNNLPEYLLDILPIQERYEMIYLPFNPDISFLLPEMEKRFDIHLNHEGKWVMSKPVKIGYSSAIVVILVLITLNIGFLCDLVTDWLK